ncbi:MAG: hypothetical protein ACU833_13885 [Gammaproteobacteria bacterium]
MNISRSIFLGVFCFFLSFPPAYAMTSCKLAYNLKGWSFFYKQYSGSGVVTCDNGQRANVRLSTKGGGVSFGKSEVNDGKGKFSEVRDISDVFGTYVALDSHAGAAKSVEAQVMTKGEVSLAITGKGNGFNLGVTLSGFTISPR